MGGALLGRRDSESSDSPGGPGHATGVWMGRKMRRVLQGQNVNGLKKKKKNRLQRQEEEGGGKGVKDSIKVPAELKENFQSPW